jgi:hypothetical protein
MFPRNVDSLSTNYTVLIPLKIVFFIITPVRTPNSGYVAQKTIERKLKLITLS